MDTLNVDLMMALDTKSKDHQNSRPKGHRSKNAGMGGVLGGYGEGLLVCLKEVLSNSQRLRKGNKAWLRPGRRTLTWTRDIVKRVKEHFGELLEGEESEDSGEVSPISLAEVSEVVKKPFRGKTSRMDEIHPEMLKGLDIVQLSLGGRG